MARAIKQTIPFDSMTMREETNFNQPRIKEQILVKINGIVADRFTRKLFTHDTTVKYMGMNHRILGDGFARFISL